MSDCGITGCSEPKIGFTEMVSIHHLKILHPLCINVCQTHMDEIRKSREGRNYFIQSEGAAHSRISGWPPGTGGP